MFGVYNALLLQHSIQDRMLDDLGNRMDNAQGHLGNVNGRMKDVLKKVYTHAYTYTSWLVVCNSC
jgi:hypothetical protein